MGDWLYQHADQSLEVLGDLRTARRRSLSPDGAVIRLRPADLVTAIEQRVVQKAPRVKIVEFVKAPAMSAPSNDDSGDHE